MKSKIIKFGLVTYLLLTNIILFAKDDGGDILGDGTVENGPTDPGDVPINSYLIWLILIAILFSLYLYKTKKVKE
ncbi:MAG: hypothetical protein NTX74_03965 [Flavobacterium sp.]|nr:hypothetical protein [Flavobacterium sp.]